MARVSRTFARSRSLTAAGEIPDSVHYRPSKDPKVQCATCAYYTGGHCNMFDAPVSPSYVCDKWEAITADHAIERVPASTHNDVLDVHYEITAAREAELIAVLEPILTEAGNQAAAKFSAKATDHLTASPSFDRDWGHLAALGASGARDLVRSLALTAGAPSSTSVMIAVVPRADEAAALGDIYPEDPAELHVTLAYMGEVPGSLSPLVEALRPVATQHAPLEGEVGGVGSFDDNGKGYPAILLPSVPGLVELRVAITQALHEAGLDYSRNYGYLPHMTVDYSDDETAIPARDGVKQPLHFDDIVIVRGGNETLNLPLCGPAPVTASAEPSIEDEIAKVAEEHAPEGGYGETYWDESRGAVFWNHADWTSDDEHDAAESAFRAIEGVKEFDCDAEAGNPGDGYVKVWPRAVTAAASPIPAAQKALEKAQAELTDALASGDQARISIAKADVAVRRGALDAAVKGPSWASPAPDELVDVKALTQSLRTKTDPIRMATVKGVMTDTLSSAGLSFDVTNPLTARVLAQAGSQVKTIAETTQVNVMKIIGESYKQGLSVPDTASAIQVGMKEASTVRATLIARTELAGAVNGGSLAATQIVGQTTGDKYQKVWLTAPGATYPRHEDYDGLDGQTVDLDAQFVVGEDMLQYPGDPDGDPEEVCNCRCTMVYEDAAGEEANAPADEEG